MDIAERKSLRKTILRQAYKNYFDLKREGTVNEYNIKDEYENEIYLACVYLDEKGLLKVKHTNTKGHIRAEITTAGIDYVEDVITLEE